MSFAQLLKNQKVVKPLHFLALFYSHPNLHNNICLCRYLRTLNLGSYSLIALILLEVSVQCLQM